MPWQFATWENCDRSTASTRLREAAACHVVARSDTLVGSVSTKSNVSILKALVTYFSCFGCACELSVPRHGKGTCVFVCLVVSRTARLFCLYVWNVFLVCFCFAINACIKGLRQPWRSTNCCTSRPLGDGGTPLFEAATALNFLALPGSRTTPARNGHQLGNVTNSLGALARVLILGCLASSHTGPTALRRVVLLYRLHTSYRLHTPVLCTSFDLLFTHHDNVHLYRHSAGEKDRVVALPS
jgi:hypothetical protein